MTFNFFKNLEKQQKSSFSNLSARFSVFFKLFFSSFQITVINKKMALQSLGTDGIEGCEFSKKFRAETSGDMEKLMACLGH